MDDDEIPTCGAPSVTPPVQRKSLLMGFLGELLRSRKLGSPCPDLTEAVPDNVEQSVVPPSAPEAAPARTSCMDRVEQMEYDGYRLFEHAAVVGRRLAEDMEDLFPLSPHAWIAVKPVYRDYLDAQRFLFERYSDLVSIRDMRHFVAVAGGYLYGTRQEGCTDYRFEDAVLQAGRKMDGDASRSASRSMLDIASKVAWALKMYREHDIDIHGDDEFPPVESPPQKAVKLMPENIRAIEADCNVKLTPENIENIESAISASVAMVAMSRDSENIQIVKHVKTDTKPEAETETETNAALEMLAETPPEPPRPAKTHPVWHPVTRLAETYPDLSKRWVDLGDAALERTYKSVWPSFLTRPEGLESLMEEENALRDREAIDRWQSAMEDDFPHFQEVTRYFCGQLWIAVAGDRAPSFSPLLLLGDPGIGKTTYLRRVAADLGLSFAMQSMAGVSGGFVLTGADVTWKSAKPGFIARTFLNYDNLNPMILLDEVDKALTNTGSHYGVQETLLALLEPETSTRFVDEYLAYLQMDLSQVSFIATANDADAILDPLLSRFHVVEVSSPSRAQRRHIAQAIYRKEVQRLHLASVLDKAIPPAVLDALVAVTDGDGRSLRDVRQVLCQALGNAMMRRGHAKDSVPEPPDALDALASLDILDALNHSPDALCLEDITAARPASRSVGFLS